MVRPLRGRCFCGAVRYEVEDAFDYAMNCHCSGCRRATGSAFKPFGGIATEKFRVTAGEDNLLIYGDEAYDAHCGVCGSLLYSLVRERKFVHVTFGTLDDAPTRRPEKHIFAGSKAPWHEITDDLPQFEEHG